MATDAQGALAPGQTRRRCRGDDLNFDTTAGLEPIAGLLGQARAEEALRFGIGIPRRGFNLFVLGPPGVGKHRLVKDALAAHETGSIPRDWIYVHRFDAPDRPRALGLPAGRGRQLRDAMEALTAELGPSLSATFESDDYANRRQALEEKVEARHQEAFSRLATAAEERSLRLLRTPVGFAFAPVRDGEVLNPEKFGALEPKEQESLQAKMEEMESELRDVMRAAPVWKREAHAELRELEREMGRFAVAALLSDIRDSFRDLEGVLEWLAQVEDDVVEHVHAFLIDPDAEGQEAMMMRALRPDPSGRYRVNLLVDCCDMGAAPIVEEDHPTLERLFGRIDRRAHFGALVSDFTMIKAGALHRANGGTLVLDARRLLLSPMAWDTLKRTLTRGEIEIESLGRTLGMSTESLDPDPIPLDVKVILIGDRRLYYLLSSADPDFDHLFKVAADLADEVPWDDEHAVSFARLIAGITRAEELRPFEADAVGRVLEAASRWAGDQRKLSTEITRLSDLLREADWRARERGADIVTRDDVRAAIRAGRQREWRLPERLLERFADGTILVDTSGEAVGQVNSLSVLAAGHTRFGQPSRITSRVRAGKGEIVDIERDVELGGPTHSKGVMILASYLAATYGIEQPLSLSASLVFEQSYGGVEGDSASMAELCALLSALSELPLQQRFAITGSVNQHGQAQIVGGANEKIEGFFDVCAARGLDGTHAVIIPRANVPHLMLREDVVDAIEAGRFAVHPMRTLDDALALLTGGPADAVHDAVRARLSHFADRAMERAQRARAPKGEA